MFAIAAATASAYTDDGGCVEEHAGSGCGDENDADEVADEQHALARIAVGEDACERSDESRGNEAKHEKDADRRLAADSVRIDGDGDQEGPVPEDRRGPGKLEVSQVPVREDVPERRSRVCDPLLHPRHAEQHLTPACSIEAVEGRSLRRVPSS